MLERYFIKPETVDRIRASWLGEPIEQYVGWLTEQGYAARNVFRRVPLLMQFGQFAWTRGARTVDELPGHVSSFADDWLRRRQGHRQGERASKSVYNEACGPVQQFLRLALPDYSQGGRCQRMEAPSSADAPRFFNYLQEERGLRESSIRHFKHYLRRFEKYLKSIQLDDLRDLSPAVLSAFVTNCGGRRSAGGLGGPLSRSSMSGLCSSLRVFLRYLYREQLVERDLSRVVESPQRYRLSQVPRFISWDDVGRVLEMPDRRTPVGRRDYAILLLLVTYGLRAREVAALTLDDIDWRRERLSVCERKAGHSTAYPLSTIVGEALLAYLRQDRPETSDRHVFFRALAPQKPLTHVAVSNQASKYLRRAGIDVARPGSHTFRHACVQRLVEADFSFKTIGDYVGHRCASSTEIYTKVAIEDLREVALGAGEEIL